MILTEDISFVILRQEVVILVVHAYVARAQEVNVVNFLFAYHNRLVLLIDMTVEIGENLPYYVVRHLLVLLLVVEEIIECLLLLPNQDFLKLALKLWCQLLEEVILVDIPEVEMVIDPQRSLELGQVLMIHLLDIPNLIMLHEVVLYFLIV